VQDMYDGVKAMIEKEKELRSGATTAGAPKQVATTQGAAVTETQCGP